MICLDADLFLPLKAKFEAPSFKSPPHRKNFAATQARRDIYKEASERVVAIAEHEDPFIGEDKMKIVWTECAEEYSRRAGLESANTQLITTEKEDLQKVDAHISKYDIASDISKLIKRQKGVLAQWASKGRSLIPVLYSIDQTKQTQRDIALRVDKLCLVTATDRDNTDRLLHPLDHNGVRVPSDSWFHYFTLTFCRYLLFLQPIKFLNSSSLPRWGARTATHKASLDS